MLELNSQNFEAEVKQSELPVMVDFWAPWCGPCKALSPVVEKLAEELAGKVKVMKCNIDEYPKLLLAFPLCPFQPFLSLRMEKWLSS